MAGEPAAATDAVVDAFLAASTPEVRAIYTRLRVVMQELFPGSVEWTDAGDRLVGFGRTRTMRDTLFGLVAHRSHVNVQFADGVELSDPEGLVEGTGKRIRHVKVRTVAAADSPALRALIEDQLRRRS